MGMAARGGNWAAKDTQVEQKLCEELAALAAGFDVANDPSAKGLPSGRCSVRLRETAMYVAAATGQETTMDYDTLLVERDHASKSFQNAMDCGALPAYRGSFSDMPLLQIGQIDPLSSQMAI